MDNFTYETVEQLDSFATFLVNYRGRIMDVRNPATRTAHIQIESWASIVSELQGRLKDQEEALEQSGAASRVISSTRLYENVLEHITELDRLIARLQVNVTEAQTLEQQLLASDRDLGAFEESTIDAGASNLRRYAEAIRQYMEVMGSR